MHISARNDYAVQAMLAIAARRGGPISTADLAAMQHIPAAYLATILADLRRAGLLSGRPGIDGGYSLAQPPEQISVGDVMRAVSGALISVRGRPPQTIRYEGVAAGLAGFWQTVHLAVSNLLDTTRLSDLLVHSQPVALAPQTGSRQHLGRHAHLNRRSRLDAEG